VKEGNPCSVGAVAGNAAGDDVVVVVAGAVAGAVGVVDVD